MMRLGRGAIHRSVRLSLKGLGLIAFAALSGCASLSPPPLVETPTMASQSDYSRGAAAFAAGYYGKAAQAFHAAVVREPESIAALNGLAAAYDHLGRYDLAARYYGRAMTIDPASPQTLNNIGYSYILQGKFDLAAVFLRDAQATAPNDPAIAANRAVAEAALRERRDPPSAEWSRPSNLGVAPELPPRIERRTPTLHTLSVRPASLREPVTVPAHSVATPIAPATVPLIGQDTLPGLLSAPIGDTRMGAFDNPQRFKGAIPAPSPRWPQ